MRRETGRRVTGSLLVVVIIGSSLKVWVCLLGGARRGVVNDASTDVD
jgi:hypothetical protein